MSDKELSRTAEETPQGNGATTGSEDPATAIALLKETLNAVRAERDNLQDRLLRNQAEFENIRKRLERDKNEFLQFANAELLRELLNALDSFELALRETAGPGESAEAYRKGFELIFKQFLDILGRFGVKPMDAIGQPFDPNLHQAVSTETNDEVAENTVLSQMRKGYMLHGRLLRPAMVSVSARTKN